MKEILKAVFPWAMAMTVISLGFLYFIKKGFNQAEGLKQDMESFIGDTIILSGDTTIVVDYSILNETYTLSNGVTVSRKIVE